MTQKLRIGVVGGGLGGLTAALCLIRQGFEVHVFEQTRTLTEVGAGIGLSPNALRVLRAIGLEEEVKSHGTLPEAAVGLDWKTGRQLYRVPLKGVAEAKFGATNIQLHRADLLAILAAAIPRSQLHLHSRCTAVSSSDRNVLLTFADGRQEEFDLAVGCDGVRSKVREALHGPDDPRFTGNICWRALIAAEKLPFQVPAQTTNWIGRGGHIVTTRIRGGALINVVAVRETSHWAAESWSIEASPNEILAAYPKLHRDVQTLLEHAERCFKWGLFDRDPLLNWSKGRITLLGDAAHPMLPFLGQGAAMAIEDACVLALELRRSPQDVAAAFCAYEAKRVPRTARVQLASRDRAKLFHKASPISRLGGLLPVWLRGESMSKSINLPTEWLYSYDATHQPT